MTIASAGYDENWHPKLARRSVEGLIGKSGVAGILWVVAEDRASAKILRILRGDIMLATVKHPSLQAATAATKSDFLPLNGTDYVEFYVGNARQAAYFYRAAFGMKLVAYAGSETGLRDRASYVVEQGKVRFVMTTPLRPDNSIADHIAKHGDGIKDIALWVDDATSAWLETTRRGARSVREPWTLEDKQGTVTMASIAT